METFVGRSANVTETVGRKKVDIAALQKVRCRNEDVKTLRGGEFELNLYWKSKDTANKSLGFMVKH